MPSPTEGPGGEAPDPSAPASALGREVPRRAWGTGALGAAPNRARADTRLAAVPCPGIHEFMIDALPHVAMSRHRYRENAALKLKGILMKLKPMARLLP